MTEISADTALIALRQILKATDANVKTLAARTGLTASQLLVLQLLKSRGETLTGQLAEAVDLKQATVSVLLDRLQEMKLISRRRGDKDRRRVWVSVTPEGERVVAGAPDLIQDMFQSRFARLPEWEQSFLITALLRIVDLLGADDIDAAPLLDVGPVDELPPADETTQVKFKL